MCRRFAVVWVDFPPDPAFEKIRKKSDFFTAVRRDKGRRILSAARNVRGSEYIMVVDDDDLIHKDLVAYIESQPERNGWAVTSGYLWRSDKVDVVPLGNFHLRCGTSLIVRTDYYEYFDQLAGSVKQKAVEELGSHRIIFDRADATEEPFGSIPFRAAVYRVNHANATQVEISKMKRKTSFYLLQYSTQFFKQTLKFIYYSLVRNSVNRRMSFSTIEDDFIAYSATDLPPT